MEEQFKKLAYKLPEDSSTRNLILQCEGYDAYKESARDEIYNNEDEAARIEILEEIINLATEAQKEWDDEQ